MSMFTDTDTDPDDDDPPEHVGVHTGLDVGAGAGSVESIPVGADKGLADGGGLEVWPIDGAFDVEAEEIGCRVGRKDGADDGKLVPDGKMVPLGCHVDDDEVQLSFACARKESKE